MTPTTKPKAWDHATREYHITTNHCLWWHEEPNPATAPQAEGLWGCRWCCLCGRPSACPGVCLLSSLFGWVVAEEGGGEDRDTTVIIPFPAACGEGRGIEVVEEDGHVCVGGGEGGDVDLGSNGIHHVATGEGAATLAAVEVTGVAFVRVAVVDGAVGHGAYEAAFGGTRDVDVVDVAVLHPAAGTAEDGHEATGDAGGGNRQRQTIAVGVAVDDFATDDVVDHAAYRGAFQAAGQPAVVDGARHGGVDDAAEGTCGGEVGGAVGAVVHEAAVGEDDTAPVGAVRAHGSSEVAVFDHSGVAVADACRLGGGHRDGTCGIAFLYGAGIVAGIIATVVEADAGDLTARHHREASLASTFRDDAAIEVLCCDTGQVGGVGLDAAHDTAKLYLTVVKVTEGRDTH